MGNRKKIMKALYFASLSSTHIASPNGSRFFYDFKTFIFLDHPTLAYIISKNAILTKHNGEFSVKKVKKITISQNFGNELVKTYRI